ncbi:MAG: discoidin domain-containing protein [Magnetococcus sp. XQGC-1]
MLIRDIATSYMPTPVLPAGDNVAEVNPIMTGYNTFSYPASGLYNVWASSSENEDSYAGWRAFGAEGAWKGASTGSPWTIQMDYGSGNSTSISEYKVKAGFGSWSPRDWTFQGSTDGSNWTVLDTRSGFIWGNNEEKTFLVASPASYRYYKMVITAGNSGGSMEINALTFTRLGAATTTALQGTFNTIVYLAAGRLAKVEALIGDSGQSLVVKGMDGSDTHLNIFSGMYLGGST